MTIPAVGFRNGDLVLKNITFDYTTNPQVAQPGVITADGQLLIGSVTTHPDIAMQAGNLVCADGTVIISYDDPNIVLSAPGGGGGGGLDTITGNSGGAIPGNAGNINLLTANTTVKVAGVVATNTLTMDFGLSNLLIGANGSITSGAANTAIGNFSLGLNTVGISNCAVGTSSLQLNTTGGSNVAIGANSLSNFSAGGLSNVDTNNVCIGTNSLISLLTGVSNTCIGNRAGFNYASAESSNILISSLGVVGESNTTRIGISGSGTAQQNRAFMAGIFGVTVADSAPVAVDVNGQLSTLGFGTSGQVLTSNGAAASPTWQTSTIPVSGLNTLTPDTGGAINPVAGNINVLGIPVLAGQSRHLQTQTFNIGGPNLQIKAPNCALFIVDPQVLYGTHTTIQSAINDASIQFANTAIPQTVFIRPGVYTENITMAAGVSLQGFCSEFGVSSTLLGSMSFGSVGVLEVNSILIKTNGSVAILGTSGSGAKITFNNCGLLATNANLINVTVAHDFRFAYCWGQVTAMGICFVTVAVGIVSFHWCRLTNPAASVTYNTMNSGELDLNWTYLQMPIACNGASNFAIAFSTFGGGGPINVPGLVHNGGVGTYFVTNSTIGGGGVNNPAMIVNGTGGIIFNGNCVLGNNSGTVMASGTGSIAYNAFNFFGPGNLITIASQTTQAFGPRIALSGGPQILGGSGSPAGVITAPQGSLWLRTDGTTINNRYYINTNGGTGWTNGVTAA